MDYAKESLRLHGQWQGKIEVVSTVPVTNREELSLAFPGIFRGLSMYGHLTSMKK